jgi:hypothetical protein
VVLNSSNGPLYDYIGFSSQTQWVSVNMTVWSRTTGCWEKSFSECAGMHGKVIISCRLTSFNELVTACSLTEEQMTAWIAQTRQT